ncbi:preprotein translocase subunit YajC [Rhodoluna limnophila]|uniref:preprotein translocase subunit YajC n=1 Tax=Rhodoluna limnophila TaxID=232537 RepID=UPI001106DA18|nr:preprotein translocase subunit YajC [Rhodoluna limnophila]
MPVQEIFLYVALAVLIAMMFNNSRKRKKQAAELQAKITVGASVTLYSGIIGEIVSLEDDRMILETTPGTKLTVAKAAIRSVDAAAPVAKPAAKKPAAKAAATSTATAAKKAPAKPAAKAAAKPAAKPAAKKPAAK